MKACLSSEAGVQYINIFPPFATEQSKYRTLVDFKLPLCLPTECLC